MGHDDLRDDDDARPMIATFLVVHPWLSPTALAVLVALGPFVVCG